MGRWQPGMIITASRMSVESVQVEDTNSQTTTNTAYADLTGGPFAASLIVPASGAVMVEMRATGRNQEDGKNAITSWRAVGSASGTVYSPNDRAGLIVAGRNNVTLDFRYRLSGLVPGETLTATMLHRVNTTGIGGIWDYRVILIEGAF